jgi:hypothetical protein
LRCIFAVASIRCDLCAELLILALGDQHAEVCHGRPTSNHVDAWPPTLTTDEETLVEDATAATLEPITSNFSGVHDFDDLYEDAGDVPFGPAPLNGIGVTMHADGVGGAVDCVGCNLDEFREALRARFTPEDISMMRLSSGSQRLPDACVDAARVAFDFGAEPKGCYSMAQIRSALRSMSQKFPHLLSFSIQQYALPALPTPSVIKTQLPDLPTITFPRIRITDAVTQLLNRDLVMPGEYVWYSAPPGSPYRHFNTGRAWRAAESKHQTGKGNDLGRRLLYLVFYTDETVKSTVGGQRYYPVYMTLGNFPESLRRSPRAWILVGLIPTWKVPAKVAGYGEEYSRSVRNKCWEVIVEDICDMLNRADTADPFIIGHDARGCPLVGLSVLGCILGDNPELAKLCACFASAQCRHPCRVCMVIAANLDKFPKQPEAVPPLRTSTDSMNRYHQLAIAISEKSQRAARKALKKASQKPWECSFWKCPLALGRGEIYQSTPADLLHTLGTGIVKRLLLWTFEVSRKQHEMSEISLQTRWNLRFATMPPFSDGVHRLKHIRAINFELKGYLGTEILSIFQQVVAVIGFDNELIPNVEWREHVQQVLQACYRIVQQLYTRSSWTEEQLDVLDDSIRTFLSEAAKGKALAGLPKLSLAIPKVHALTHFSAAVRNFGVVHNVDAGPCEGLHVGVKKEGDRAAHGAGRDISLMRRDASRNLMLHVLDVLDGDKSKAALDFVFLNVLEVDATTNLRGSLLQLADGSTPEYSCHFHCKDLAHLCKQCAYRRGIALPSIDLPPFRHLAHQIAVQCLQIAQATDSTIQIPNLGTFHGQKAAIDIFEREIKAQVYTSAIVKAPGKRNIAYKLHSVLESGKEVSVVSVAIPTATGETIAALHRVEFFIQATYGTPSLICPLVVLRPFESLDAPGPGATFARVVKLERNPSRSFVLPLACCIRPEFVMPHFVPGSLTNLLRRGEGAVCAASRKENAQGHLPIEEDDHSDNDERDEEDDDILDVPAAPVTRAMYDVARGPIAFADATDDTATLRRLTTFYEASSCIWSLWGILA